MILTPDRVAALTEIWRTVLGNPDLDDNSDLFENRGSSLHVLQITAQIYDVLGMDVSLRDVFSHPSPRSLSDLLDGEAERGDFNKGGTNP
jgi:Phosphopantetheine attachment site